MFVLRQITKKGQTSNLAIGDHYSVIHKDRDSDFDHLAKDNPDPEKLYAVLVYNNGKHEQQNWPLYQGFSYYIMTDSGKTFDNLTFK